MYTVNEFQPTVVVSANYTKTVLLLQLFFACTSIIAIVPLYLVIVCSLSHLLAVLQEHCTSSLWPSLGNFIYRLYLTLILLFTAYSH